MPSFSNSSWARSLLLFHLLTTNTLAQAAVRGGISRNPNVVQPQQHIKDADDRSSSCLACHVVRPEVLRDDDEAATAAMGESTSLRCLTAQLSPASSSSRFRSNLALEGMPKDLLAANQEAMEEGEWHICIQDYTIQDNTVFVLENSEILDHSGERRLQNQNVRTGTRRLLAVRVSSAVSGEEPEETVELIESAIFGTGSNPEGIALPEGSVVQQYAAISHGQLTFQPAQGPNINNGVLEISIDESFVVSTDVESEILPRLIAATEQAVGSSDIADKIVYCLPTGAGFQGSTAWTAFTYLYEPYSYFQKSRCTRLSVVIHEIGHSIGFHHSGFDGDEYLDKTGYMGYAINKLGIPRKAFNGHKHWISGWFGDRAIEIDPFDDLVRVDKSFIEKRLVSFVHYGDDNLQPEDVVLILADKWHIQYNRAKRYNVDTEKPNTVTVTTASRDSAVSDRRAALVAGQSYFDGNLVVAVCETVELGENELDYAVIRIYQGTSDPANVCSLPFPTIVTTPSPTIEPTDPPSPSPTKLPTDPPSPSPTKLPTDRPSPEPTLSPTDRSTTFQPIYILTNAPVPSPTNPPPTVAPVPVPTVQPIPSLINRPVSLSPTSPVSPPEPPVASSATNPPVAEPLTTTNRPVPLPTDSPAPTQPTASSLTPVPSAISLSGADFSSMPFGGSGENDGGAKEKKEASSSSLVDASKDDNQALAVAGAASAGVLLTAVLLFVGVLKYRARRELQEANDGDQSISTTADDKLANIEPIEEVEISETEEMDTSESDDPWVGAVLGVSTNIPPFSSEIEEEDLTEAEEMMGTNESSSHWKVVESGASEDLLVGTVLGVSTTIGAFSSERMIEEEDLTETEETMGTNESSSRWKVVEGGASEDLLVGTVLGVSTTKPAFSSERMIEEEDLTEPEEVMGTNESSPKVVESGAPPENPLVGTVVNIISDTTLEV